MFIIYIIYIYKTVLKTGVKAFQHSTTVQYSIIGYGYQCYGF